MKKRICFILAGLLATVAQGDFSMEKLSKKVAERNAELSALIAEADEKGLCTDYARTSEQMVTLFQTAAQWDHENLDEVKRVFETFRWKGKVDTVTKARQLAVDELKACLDVVDHAMAQLKAQLSGELSVQPAPDFSTGQMKLKKDRFVLDGETVFPYSLVWTPEGPIYRDTFGYLGGGFFQTTHLKENGQVAAFYMNREKARLQEETDRNVAPIVFLLGDSPAKWMVRKHPEIKHGARHFTGYDIDSPLVRNWVEQLCAGMLPQLSASCGETPIVHLLANEPHFATRKGGWRVDGGLSDVTMEKWVQWLKDKYKKIENLNDVYDADHVSFEQVLFDGVPPRNRQIGPWLRGTPVWYDWCRFNMDRVNDWFAFLKKTTQAHDGGRSAPVSIKTLGKSLSRNTRDGGIDVEYLTKLQDVMGADLRVTPRGATFYGKHEEGVDQETGWLAYYAYEWLEQSMYLDFSKSICPEKPFYDSEWHGFGTVSWRHYSLSREYVRSALWLAFSHGMSMIQPWVWGRNADGSMKSGHEHIGSLSTQPVAVDAYARVMKELNAHGDEVASFVPEKRELLVYYCEASAIQDETYTKQLGEVYESLKLLNLSVGFTTPSEIGTLDPKTQTVIVSPTPNISDAALAALKAFNGKTVQVGESFGKDEMGNPRKDADWRASDSLEKQSVMAMLPDFEKLFGTEYTIRDEDGKKAVGVMISRSGNRLLLNNVSLEPRTVQLPAGTYTDRLTGRKMKTSVKLNSCDILLLERSE